MNPKDLARANWRTHFENRSVREADAAPKFEVRNAADSSAAEVLIYSEIGYYGVDAKSFAQAMAGITAPKITVRINSPGGDVFDGLAMFNTLKAHPAKIETVVDGLAASAASFIMLAGDTVSMNENSIAMIHSAWALGIGNAVDLRELAATLDKVDGQLANMYAKKSGKDLEEINAAMAAETWFTAEEAKTFGLVDSVITDEPADDKAKNAAEDELFGLATPRISAMRRRLRVAAHEG
ncbi:MAG TPA: head maturation protease, ClpP-related [Reyranella sp.]|nr:head maturation protease, ClpP-related [Reyranella sp.]